MEKVTHFLIEHEAAGHRGYKMLKCQSYECKDNPAFRWPNTNWHRNFARIAV
jgi:hypothetical protein